MTSSGLKSKVITGAKILAFFPCNLQGRRHEAMTSFALCNETQLYGLWWNQKGKNETMIMTKLIHHWKTDYKPAAHACSYDIQPYPGLHQRRAGQQVRGGDNYPLLCLPEIPPAALHSALGRKIWNCWSGSGGGP